MFAACNEAAQTDVGGVVEARSPAGVGAGVPSALSSHRQMRAHDAALRPLMGDSGVVGGQDPFPYVQFALADIDELDGMVRTSLHRDEEQLQVDVSEHLLTAMVRELAVDIEAIDSRRQSSGGQ